MPPVISTKQRLGVWSASPTPLTEALEIDLEGLGRCIDHHVALGCDGIMLAGTCGEGPWLRDGQIETLVRAGLERAAGRLPIAVQVTDNSPGRILDRIEAVAKWGGQFVVVAQPFFLVNATPTRLCGFYASIFDRSPLPVFFYDRGKASSVFVPAEILEEIVSHPRVMAVKDSACDTTRFAGLNSARLRRPELRIYCGNEFGVLAALKAGYNGSFLGGAAVTARAVRECQNFYFNGELDAAAKLDAETRAVLYDIYGGPTISCWLAGLKYALIRLGIFSTSANLPGFALSEECRLAVDRVVEEVKWLRPA